MEMKKKIRGRRMRLPVWQIWANCAIVYLTINLYRSSSPLRSLSLLSRPALTHCIASDLVPSERVHSNSSAIFERCFPLYWSGNFLVVVTELLIPVADRRKKTAVSCPPRSSTEFSSHDSSRGNGSTANTSLTGSTPRVSLQARIISPTITENGLSTCGEGPISNRPI